MPAASIGPLISIVTPTFNQGGTIEQTIRSVLEQDYPRVEYLVFDAGSTDGTLEILRRYEHDPRFRWVSEPDRGQSHAIGKGLAQCTGEIFNWINSDDYLEPGALGKVAAAFVAAPDALIVSGYTDEFRDGAGEVFNRTELQLRASAEEAITVGVYCQPSTFWRTAIMRELGGPEEDYHFTMDWDLWVKFLLRHGQDRVRKIDELLALYRHHAGAKTTKSSRGFYEDAARVFDRLHAQLEAPDYFRTGADSKSPAAPPLAIGPHFRRDLYLSKYCERMVRITRKKDKAAARLWLRRSFDRRPWPTAWRVKMAGRLLLSKIAGN